MSDHDDYRPFLPNEEMDDEKIVVEVPSNSGFPYQERTPAGYEPMEAIQLRGITYRRLAGGRIPWWVLISGWILYGGLILVSLIPAIAAGGLLALLTLIVGAIPLIILGRGTAAKLSLKKRKRRRR